MGSWSAEGGCPSDYVAVAISTLVLTLFIPWFSFPFLSGCLARLICRSIFPFFVHKASRTKGSGFWIPLIQIFASCNLIVSIVMSVNFFKYKKNHWWLSCYVWAVWVEGPLGFGLLLSCRIVQAFQLYFIFVRRRLPPLRSHVSLPLFVLPWVAMASLVHIRKPLNDHCHMRAQWVIPSACFHALYVTTLVVFTWAIHHIEFRFNEVRDLWRGILVSASSIGVWIVAYILNELHDKIAWLQVTSRFFLLVTTSILVLAFFSISSSQPLLSQISLRKREPVRFETMGQALGIPDSGLLLQTEPSQAIGPTEPLDKLLHNKRFRKSFMAFADSCLAGECVHFYEDVYELNKISEHDTVRRIYMARDIIDTYITAGAKMEVNISHRCRQEILTTLNLAHRDLFKSALNEVLQLMKTNLANDYWSSMFFLKFKEEASIISNNHEMEQVTAWNFSPRLSTVHSADDPFQLDHLSRGPSNQLDIDSERI